ncbi:MAG: ABC transporter permease [Candidatus Eremiobacteraeota bacterium]|nr:ABC transporter permease [Candidatus Eremiobacteraeota bacterium]
MKRFVSLLGWDIKLQAKYGFYYAAGFVALMWIVVMSLLPPDKRIIILPFFLFIDLLFTAFYFMAGLIFLEKVQGVLNALVLTPTKLAEYLMSKVLTIAFLSVVFCLLITLLAHGTRFNIPMLALTVFLTSLLCSFIGIASAAYCASFSRFLIPSLIPQLIMAAPLCYYFGLYKNWLFYIFPTQPCLLLFKSSFIMIESWQLIYSIVYLIFWLVLTYIWAYKNLQKFILS